MFFITIILINAKLINQFMDLKEILERNPNLTLDDIQANMSGIAEGVTTTLAVWKMALDMGLEMPITETMHKVLYEGADINKTARELMNVSAAHELVGRKWRLFSAFRRRKRKDISTTEATSS